MYQNLHPETLPDEMALAKQLGALPARIGTPEFDRMVQNGLIKWVVSPAEELWSIPALVEEREVMHPTMVAGGPVLAAGRALLIGTRGHYTMLEINNHSNHYRTPAESLPIGVAAFEREGVYVDPASIKPFRYP